MMVAARSPYRSLLRASAMESRSQRRRRTSYEWLALAVVLALGTLSCGDDGGSAPPSSTPAKKNPRAGAKPQAANAAKSAKLQFYPKIEGYAADDDEAKSLRRPFSSRDFDVDVTGEENRDPFRSYVIRQPGVGTQDRSTSTAEPAEFCTNKSLVAPNYPLRDLRLVGIVLRGTGASALFRDSANYGHIVHKGDCLGQERARVGEIRTGFVSLEVMPDPSLSQDPKPAQERAIQLYPEELPLETTE